MHDITQNIEYDYTFCAQTTGNIFFANIAVYEKTIINCLSIFITNHNVVSSMQKTMSALKKRGSALSAENREQRAKNADRSLILKSWYR